MCFRSAVRKMQLLSLGLSAAALSQSDAQTEHRTLSGDRVSIYNLAGKLRLQPGSGAQVVVDVTRGGGDASKLKLATGDIRGWNSLRVVYPSDRIVYPDMGYRSRTQLRVNGDGTFDDKEGDHGFFDRDRVEIRGSGPGLEAHADMTVSIPKGQRIVIHWGVGDATVTNVDGDIRVSVATATVTSEHTKGRLNLDTGSGAVKITDAQGDVTLDTGSGGVTVTGVKGETLNIDTGSGSITGSDIDVRTLKADVGSGGIRLGRIHASHASVDAGSGGTELEFLSALDDLAVDAGSGGVTIRLPAAQGADVEIETGSGGIESDFPVQTNKVQRNYLRGRIGDGKGRIKIESGSGRVRLIKN
ncbi:MAG: hypothetical protein JWM41_838 [Gemmatimonadetes bacterium]|nr:hypothetical protein [Gemmatimonadota bacterium]